MGIDKLGRPPANSGMDAVEEPEYVDTSDPVSVCYWAHEFHLSEPELLRAVKSVGPQVKMLRSLLGCL